jgi:hypothetical protein
MSIQVTGEHIALYLQLAKVGGCEDDGRWKGQQSSNASHVMQLKEHRRSTAFADADEYSVEERAR